MYVDIANLIIFSLFVRILYDILHFYVACSVEQELTIIFTENIRLIHEIFENIIFLCKNIWMNGETLPRLVRASIIKVALTKNCLSM